MCPVFLLVTAVLVGGARGTLGQCWEHPSCQEVTSESSLMECLQLCRSLSNETPLVPGEAHLQAPPPSDSLAPPPSDLLALPLSDLFFPPSSNLLAPPSSYLLAPPPSNLLAPPPSAAPQAKRSYSMEHFRWGKPVGRKRRPVKIYEGAEPNEIPPAEMRRRGAGLDTEGVGLEAEGTGPEEEREEEEAAFPDEDVQQKKDAYKMKHFRWGGPVAKGGAETRGAVGEEGAAAQKRYGGFMKSYEERSQTPLLTLFRNVINKDGQDRRRRGHHTPL